LPKQHKKVKWDYENFDGDSSNVYDEGWKLYLGGTELWEYVPDSNENFMTGFQELVFIRMLLALHSGRHLWSGS
jgi:hypothetical protein